MADTKFTGLTAQTTPLAGDIFPFVTDPGGTPTGKKVTFANIEASLTIANQIGGAATGTGNIVRASSPTLTTPTIGAATATSINGLTITASTGVLTITNAKTFAVTNTLTLSGTDSTTMTFPSTSATIARTDAANTFTGASTASAWVLTSPTITTGIVPTSNDGAALGSTSNQFSDVFLAEGGVINWDNGDFTITQANNVLTFAGGTITIPTPFTLDATSVTTTGTQLNYLNAATGTTGTTSTNVVFSTSPTLITPTLGVASATTINKVTITAPATSATLTIADGKTLTASNTITFSGTDAVAMNVTNNKIATITFIIDGGGSAITTGVKGDLEIPFDCTITAATLLADQSGSIVVDIWKDTYANYPPTVADTITASAKPTISTATKSQDTTLTGWTTSVTAGNTLRFNVDSITTCTRVTLSLKVNKT